MVSLSNHGQHARPANRIEARLKLKDRASCAVFPEHYHGGRRKCWIDLAERLPAAAAPAVSAPAAAAAVPVTIRPPAAPAVVVSTGTVAGIPARPVTWTVAAATSAATPSASAPAAAAPAAATPAATAAAPANLLNRPGGRDGLLGLHKRGGHRSSLRRSAEQHSNCNKRSNYIFHNLHPNTPFLGNLLNIERILKEGEYGDCGRDFLRIFFRNTGCGH